MRKSRCLLSVMLAILQQVLAIVDAGRDLVLTPKQELQLNGKRIFYEEQQPGAAGATGATRPWERTLKHVSYVTLFTDAALGAASGNLSQLHDYHDFLQTPYIPAAAQVHASPSRFGDIVTLASGRLEQLLSNGSYRFLEGEQQHQHDHMDQGVQTRALWRVQRIRHRDGIEPAAQRLPQRYHYEMKFSVSPLASNIGWPVQSFIQKESDYPQSFGRLSYEEQREQAFAQRRQDRDRQPQATFVRGIFQQPPPNLNIGEYLNGVPELTKGGSPSKIELFPSSNLFNIGMRPSYIAATTYRPSYPPQFAPRAQLSTPLERYPLPNDLSSGGISGGGGSSNSNASKQGVSGAAATPFTHHFHHHFYMTNDNQAVQHPELGRQYHPPSSYVPELTTLATPPAPLSHHHSHHYNQLEHELHQEVQFPPHQHSHESLETGEDQRPFQRSPQIFQVYEEQTSKYHRPNKLPPLLIYAGGIAAEAGEEQKTFVQSEPLEETIYRYSEPDPLYVQQQPPVDVLQDAEEQLQQQQHEETVSETNDRLEEQSDEEQDEESEQRPEQRPAGSQKQSKLVTTPATTTTTTTKEPTSTTTTSTTTAALATTPTTSIASFVSSSTSITPLRALSRYRTTPRITAGKSTTTTTTTTTELPALSKWKLRRKENVTSVDSKAKSSRRYESKIIFLPATTTATTTTTTTAAPALTNNNNNSSSFNFNSSSTPAPVQKVIEVLTQKSVSRSVSIKVGENGEEIPIIVDDDENEVKRS